MPLPKFVSTLSGAKTTEDIPLVLVSFMLLVEHYQNVKIAVAFKKTVEAI